MDILLIKYDKNGNILDVKYSETENPGGGGVGSGCSGIVPMENGDVYLSGYFVGKTKFSNTKLTHVYFIDGFVWRISNLATGIIENATVRDISSDFYPNPTNGEIYFRTKENESPSIFTVSDIWGRLVNSQKANNYTEIQALDLSKLPKGTYIIRQQTVNSIYTAKVILQ
ncbi:MAG: T9SS type A sorting domain-containing protein [Pedobacter sp.]|nr:MAG: T9SS type A sorting domain-containing protein [Pedobacter sp.]